MAQSDESNNEEQETLFRKALSSALAPFYVLTSRTAIKAYLSTILFLLASLGLLTISTTAYLFFYYNYIPPINLEKTVYLQYGLGRYPFATTPLDTSALISQQPYDIEVLLYMPRTPTNLAAGNFMLDVQLLGPYNPLAKPEKALTSLLGNITFPITTGLTMLHHSRRPAILPYESQLLSLAHTSLHLPLHLVGLRDLDAATLRIPMFELLAFSRGSSNVPTHVRLEIQFDASASTGHSANLLSAPTSLSTSSTLQIYSSRIRFSARFHGLRYVVYNYRILSFLVFSTLFYTVSVFAMGIAWAVISMILAKPNNDTAIIKREDGTVQPKAESSDARIKQEAEDSDSGQGLSLSNLSDTARQFPTGSRQAPLQYQSRGEPEPAPKPEILPLKAGDAADDEEDFNGDETPYGRTTGRFEGDSGIGTSMESGREPLIVRRRSGRGDSRGAGLDRG